MCCVCPCTVTFQQKHVQQRKGAEVQDTLHVMQLVIVPSKLVNGLDEKKETNMTQCKTCKIKKHKNYCGVFFNVHDRSSAWGSGYLLHYKSLFHRRHFNMLQ